MLLAVDPRTIVVHATTRLAAVAFLLIVGRHWRPHARRRRGLPCTRAGTGAADDHILRPFVSKLMKYFITPRSTLTL